MRSAAVTWVIALVACSGQSDRPHDAAPSDANPVRDAGPPVIDPRTPTDFARDWIAASQDRPASAGARRPPGTVALRQRWEGRWFRWTGHAVAGLCVASTRTCAINVFDIGPLSPPPQWGRFRLRVELTPAGDRALRAHCGGLPTCVVTFRGRLAEIETDTDTEFGPIPGLKLVDATIEQGRPPRPDDRWFRTPSRAAAPRATPAEPRGPQPPRPTIRVRTF